MNLDSSVRTESPPRGPTNADRLDERESAYRFDPGDGETNGTDESDAEKLPRKSVHDLLAGSVVSIRTPGAGGYGDPADRGPAAIARDLRLGKVSPEFVREHYDVDPDDFDWDGA